MRWGVGRDVNPPVQATSIPRDRSRSLRSSNSPQHQTQSEPWAQKLLNSCCLWLRALGTAQGDTPHRRWWDCPVQTRPPFRALCRCLTMTSNRKALPRGQNWASVTQGWGAGKPSPPARGVQPGLGEGRMGWLPGCQCPGSCVLLGWGSPSRLPFGPGGLWFPAEY